MSTMERIARDLPTGASVHHDGVTWVKVNETWWDNGTNNLVNNRAIDHRLSLGAEIQYDVIELETEVISAFDLEPGDYVVLTRGFHEDGDHPFFEENRDQQLWRVVGWTWHGTTQSTILLDAPEYLLRDTSREMSQGESADMEPVQLHVGEEDEFRLVVPGQQHETWMFDWEDEYGLVEQPR